MTVTEPDQTAAKRVAVVGVGGVGGVFAAHLSPVHDVVACVRRPFTHYKIESNEVPFEGPANAVTSPDAIGWDAPADAVFVGLKSQHTEAAAPWFESLCGPDTLVVVMQNGIEGLDRLSPLVGDATVVPSVVYCGAELLAPGHVRHGSHSRLIVADNEAGTRARQLMDGTPLTVELSDGVDVSAWVKLAINSAANGLTALTGRPMTVMADAGVAAIAGQLITECWTVGLAAGVNLDLSRVPGMVEALATPGGEGRTSMLQDAEAGRPTEHDAIHGAVLRQAEKYSVDVPTTRLVHDLLAASHVNHPAT